jgi:hypothetical protein
LPAGIIVVEGVVVVVAGAETTDTGAEGMSVVDVVAAGFGAGDILATTYLTIALPVSRVPKYIPAAKIERSTSIIAMLYNVIVITIVCCYKAIK